MSPIVRIDRTVMKPTSGHEGWWMDEPGTAYHLLHRLLPASSPSKGPRYNSSTSLPMVGTWAGSKAFKWSGSMGTQTRPVLGCTTKGDFKRWFICLLTLMSSLGNKKRQPLPPISSQRNLKSIWTFSARSESETSNKHIKTIAIQAAVGRRTEWWRPSTTLWTPAAAYGPKCLIANGKSSYQLHFKAFLLYGFLYHLSINYLHGLY